MIKRTQDKENDVYNKVVLEDGLQNIKDLADPEKEELKDALLADAVSDNIGTNYLKEINHLS